MKRRNLKRNKSNNNTKLKRVQFLDMLRKIHLSGAINECVVIFDNGKAYSEVVDITNSVIVLADSEVNYKDKKFKMTSDNFTANIGIGNIEILIKFLSSVSDDKLNLSMSKDESRIVLSTKNGSRKMNYLTSVPDLISTRLRMQKDDDADYRKDFLAMPEVIVQIDQKEAKDLCSYIGLSHSKIVTIKTMNETVVFTVGSGTEHKLSVEVKAEDEEIDEDFQVTTNGENLAKILSSCVFLEEEPTTIGIGEESPIVILDATTLWCLTPTDNEGE